MLSNLLSSAAAAVGAHRQGHALAQCNLGCRFENGEGVAQDYAEALRLYKLAAKQGFTDAEYKLGRMYEFGCGVAARDLAEAVRWYERAAAKGEEKAKANLARLRALGV